MTIPKNLKDEIWDYCRINNISNIDEFTLKLLTQGFTVEKFGATPVNKVVEKIVEVPVEKIVEVPVDIVVEKVVEKIVEKEVYITNDTELKKLTDSIITLESINKTCLLNVVNKDKEIEQLKLDLEKINKELINEKNKNKNKKDFYGE